MDLSLFRALNGLAGHGAFWDGVIVYMASGLQYVLGALLVLQTLWPVRRIRMLEAALAAAVIARLAVKPLILLFVHRARPFISLDGVRTLVGTESGENLQSFPSGHAIFFFALAMAVYRYDKRLGAACFAGATIIGVARIIVGVHWPSDIVGGALLGMLVGWLTVQLIPPLLKVVPSRK